MTVKINVGLSKKIGQDNFGSLGATCNVEFELDGGYDNGSTERFRDAVKRAYAACREAVESELSGSEAIKTSKLGGQHKSPDRLTNQRVAAGSQTRGATANQIRAIHAIANGNKARLSDILRNRFSVSRPDELSIGDASSLIDQLKHSANT